MLLTKKLLKNKEKRCIIDVKMENNCLKYIFWLILGFVLAVIIILYVYKNVKVIRTLMQWVFMHIPILKNVIINKII